MGIQFFGNREAYGWIEAKWPAKANSMMIHYHGASGRSNDLSVLSFVSESSVDVTSWRGDYNDGLGRYKIVNNLFFPQHNVRITEVVGLSYVDSIWID